jgi:hypothetical protein
MKHMPPPNEERVSHRPTILELQPLHYVHVKDVMLTLTSVRVCKHPQNDAQVQLHVPSRVFTNSGCQNTQEVQPENQAALVSTPHVRPTCITMIKHPSTSLHSPLASMNASKLAAWVAL